MDRDSSPRDMGYRMPAEWAPHEGTWLSWPHSRATWPGCFDLVEPALVAAVRALAESENVHVNVLDADHERHVRGLLAGAVPPERVRLHRIPTNDAWVRDHGAIFVTRAASAADAAPMLALDFDYNAWGGKYPPYDLDALAAARMAEALGVPRYAPGLVLEGGSVDVNGAGALVTTEQCLLNRNRNPTWSREAIEHALCACFGVERILWLGEGIEGDDTDGHVDDLTRFVSENAVVTVVERDRRDPNFAPLEANRERLAALAGSADFPFEVLELPMPAPLYNAGERLPASYANFYVANGCVLMPAFDCPADAHAGDVLRACFPSRHIVPVDCRALVAGLGALHCLTQQVPATPQAPPKAAVAVP